MKKFFIYILLCLSICLPMSAENNKTASAGDSVNPASLVLPYKDIYNKKRIINKINNQAKELTDEEKAVIKKYVYGAVKGEDTFLLINCMLRGNLQSYIPRKEITKPLIYRLEYYANQLSISISRTRLPQNMLLYRSIDEKTLLEIFNDNTIKNTVYKPVNTDNLQILQATLHNKKYIEKGFMFVTYDKNSIQNSKFILEICAPKNLQAVSMKNLGNKTASQILINKNSVWEVTDINIDTNKKTNHSLYKIKLKFLLNDK